MKKKLEADLVSIAHRILQLKNRSEVNVMFLEVQKLYEKLAVLKFVEEHLTDVQPTIGITALEAKIENAFEEHENSNKESQNTQVEIVAPAPFVPVFEKNSDTTILSETTAIKGNATKTLISLEEILGENYVETEFVKVETPVAQKSPSKNENDFEAPFEALQILAEENEIKTPSLNEKLVKVVSIDLNDRIDFVKHLFNDNNEDYNFVLSQLNGFNDLEEIKTFINEIIKPEYNNWEGKEDYENRFIATVAKKLL